MRETAYEILRECQMRSGFSYDEFFGPKRTKAVSMARQDAMLIAHRHGFSDSEIGRILARDRTTVMHGIERAKSRTKEFVFSSVRNPCGFKSVRKPGRIINSIAGPWPETTSDQPAKSTDGESI